MSQLTGSEFNNQRGSQGMLLQWLWARIFPAVNAVLPNTAAQISTSLANYYTKTETDGRISSAVSTETAARTAAITSAISAETTARTTAIAAESSARTIAINNLKSYVDTNFDTDAEVTAKINSAIDALKAGAPAALDTLKEIADKLSLMEGSDSTVSQQLAALIATVGTKASIDSVTAVQTSVNTLSASVSANKTDAEAKVDALYTLIKQGFWKIPLIRFRYMFSHADRKQNTYAYKFFDTPTVFFGFLQFFSYGMLLTKSHVMPLVDNQSWGAINLANKDEFDYIFDSEQGIVVFNPNLFTGAEIEQMVMFYTIVQRVPTTIANDPELSAFFTQADLVL